MVQHAFICPIPANEAQRLEAVRAYDILDTLPELDFDALTRVAAHVFYTPAAVVGLMDADRLWFKSRLGLDVRIHKRVERTQRLLAEAGIEPQRLILRIVRRPALRSLEALFARVKETIAELGPSPVR